MSKRGQAAQAAKEPDHPDHDAPVWDVGDVARFVGFDRHAVLRWVRAGKLKPDENAARTATRDYFRFKPSSVIRQTPRRMPAAD